MYNWNTDSTELQKNPEKLTIWRLEQLINFGLNGEKINKKELKRYLPKLKLDPFREEFIRLILN